MEEHVMLVAESHSEWPAWLLECKDGLDGSELLTQAEDEGLSEFSSRAASAIGSLASKTSVDLGVLACNERIDDAAMKARRRIVRSMLTELKSHHDARILVTVSALACGKTRRALCEFVTELQNEHPDAPTDISVRVGLCPELDEAGESVT